MEFSVIEMILSVGSLKLTSNRQASFGFNTQYALLNDELDSTFRSICEKRQHLHLFLIRDTHEHFSLFNHQRAWSRVSSVIILHGSIFFRFEFTAVYVLWAVSCSCVCVCMAFPIPDTFFIPFNYWLFYSLCYHARFMCLRTIFFLLVHYPGLHRLIKIVCMP